MKIEAERARGVAEVREREQVDVSTNDEDKRPDVKESTKDDQSQSSVLDPILLLPAVLSSHDDQKWPDEGGDVVGTGRATEDHDDDSDSTSTSTSDELVSDMRNLRLRVGCVEPLVHRGPTGPTGGVGTRRYSDSTQFAWTTSDQYDETSSNDVRCKRKIVAKSAVINLQPGPVLPFEVFQQGTGGKGWTGWDVHQQDQQAIKFRRTCSDPQESDDRVSVTFDSSLISAVTSEIRGSFDGGSDLGELGLSLDFEPAEPNFSECCRELLPWIDDVAPPLLQSDALTHDEWRAPSYGNLLDQLNEVGPPLANCLSDPDPELPSERRHSDGSHVAETTTATTTYPSTLTSTVDATHGNSAAMDLPDLYLPTLSLPRSDWSPRPGSASALSPSADSGFASSPRSSADLPSDLIFEYVETKLRELVRYVFIRFIHYVYVLIGLRRSKYSVLRLLSTCLNV